MEWSTPAIVDGDDEEFAITDDLPRKGSTKFALHTAPLDAQLCQDDLHLQALLQDLTVSFGVASIVGAMLNAGEQSRKKLRTREVLGKMEGWIRSRRARRFFPLFRPREALQRRHDDGDDADATTTTSMFRARILAPTYRTDARDIGKDSGSFCSVQSHPYPRRGTWPALLHRAIS
jgi:hypothetical protein